MYNTVYIYIHQHTLSRRLITLHIKWKVSHSHTYAHNTHTRDTEVCLRHTNEQFNGTRGSRWGGRGWGGHKVCGRELDVFPCVCVRVCAIDIHPITLLIEFGATWSKGWIFDFGPIQGGVCWVGGWFQRLSNMIVCCTYVSMAEMRHLYKCRIMQLLNTHARPMRFVCLYYTECFRGRHTLCLLCRNADGHLLCLI